MVSLATRLWLNGQKGEHKLMELLIDIVEGSSTEDGRLYITPYQKASMEVSRYTGEVTATIGPVQCWKENSSKYPILSRLSRKYLCIQATSISAERAFSCAGNIITTKSTRFCRNAHLFGCKSPVTD